MKIVASFYTLVSLLSLGVAGTPPTAFNLIVTSSESLAIPVVGGEYMNLMTSTCMTRARVSSYMNGEEYIQVIASNGHVIPVPVTNASSGIWESLSGARTPRADPFLGRDPFMSLVPGSLFARRFRNAMLIPHPTTFTLLAGVDNPAAECYEGTIGYARSQNLMIRLNVEVSIIAPPGHDREGQTLARSPRTQFRINTMQSRDFISGDAYYELRREATAILGIPNDQNWSSLIHLLPLIQYTIYVSDQSEDVAARIVLAPEDYVELHPSGGGRLLVTSPPFGSGTDALGLNFLKHAVVLLDYENNQIGFCEPVY